MGGLKVIDVTAGIGACPPIFESLFSVSLSILKKL
jgi:hypothetical protein